MKDAVGSHCSLFLAAWHTAQKKPLGYQASLQHAISRRALENVRGSELGAEIPSQGRGLEAPS